MEKERKQTLLVQWSKVSLLAHKMGDFISLNDIIKNFWDNAMIYSRMRSKNTVEFLGTRELIHNNSFKGNEFVTFKNAAGSNSFNLTPKKRIEQTWAVGLLSKSGKYWWWTFAHKDIAFEFASWVSPKFKLFLIKDYQRLKEKELKKLDRNVKRLITKANYRIHTDAIQSEIIPSLVTRQQIRQVYVEEAELMNVIVFGKTSKEWVQQQPNNAWNMRDYATIEQLIVLANMESVNAELVRMKIPQTKRIRLLNRAAIQQMKSLLWLKSIEQLTLLTKNDI